jgi:hypothetical protein
MGNSGDELSRLLTEAGNRILKPLGLVQKGRSRFWRDDRDWFVIGVEFQPSSWSDGSYLNVGCSWLWMVQDYFSYDVGGRTGTFVKFENRHQFQDAGNIMATQAAFAVESFRKQFPNVRAVYEYYSVEESGGIWSNFNAAIASALSGEASNAAFHFKKIAEDQSDTAWATAARSEAFNLLGILSDPPLFRRAIKERVMRTRALQKLPKLLDSEKLVIP